MRRTLIPDLVLDARGAQGGLGVTIEDGRISEVGPATEGERLPGRALAPGFVNDHSHAFQRGLRGTVERIDPSRPHDDFWTWRERMYTLAEGLTVDSVRGASRRCYEEMLCAGYTSVTEFHYVHHLPDGTGRTKQAPITAKENSHTYGTGTMGAIRPLNMPPTMPPTDIIR